MERNELTFFSDNNIKDVSDFKVVLGAPGGAQDKILLENNSNMYLLKFNPRKQNGYEMPYHLSEHISCSISNQLGYNAQITEIVKYKSHICVMITLFGKSLVTFNGLGSLTLEHEKLNYDLDFIFENIKFSKFNSLERYVWDTFIIDSFVGNSDRHPNNWGFFKEDNDYVAAPLIDFGDSLFSLNAKKLTVNTDAEEVVNKWSPSAIKYKGVKYNFRELLTQVDSLIFSDVKRDFIGRLDNLDTKFIEDLKIKDSRYESYLDFVINFLNTQKRWYKEELQ